MNFTKNIYKFYSLQFIELRPTGTVKSRPIYFKFYNLQFIKSLLWQSLFTNKTRVTSIIVQSIMQNQWLFLAVDKVEHESTLI